MRHCESLYQGIAVPPVPPDSISHIEGAEEGSRQTIAATDPKEGGEGATLPVALLRVDLVVRTIQMIRMKGIEEGASLDGGAPLAIQATQAIRTTQAIQKAILAAGDRLLAQQNDGKSTIRSL